MWVGNGGRSPVGCGVLWCCGIVDVRSRGAIDRLGGPTGHHVIPWIDGGRTCLTNAVLLCRRHHRVIHRGEWEVRINPADGLPQFLPPSYLDSQRQPIRNQYRVRR